MTNQEIYNQVVWNVFGDSDVIPPSINANMFGVSGLLSRAHKFMQSNTDWWFMRSVHTEAISGEIELEATCVLGDPELTMVSETGLAVGMLAYGNNIAKWAEIVSLMPCTLSEDCTASGTEDVKFYQCRTTVPSDFKRDITMRVRYSNGSVQLVKRAPTIVMDKYMDSNDQRESYPTYYFIRNGVLYYCGTPTSAGTMMLDYYRYLPYPVAIGADDDILIELAEPMIYYCSMMIASLLQDMNKLQIFTNFYEQTLAAARAKNFNRTANFDEFRVAQLW